MFKIKNKKFFLTLFVCITLFSFCASISLADTTATGWLWGGSDDGAGNIAVGWISLSSSNTGSPISYGVNIPSSDGLLSGYAWSENVGWISFNQSDLTGCPSGECAARKTGSNITGWARILSIRDASLAGNSGGWLGWIKLSGSNYGFTLSGNSFSGYATAGADELGWIKPPCVADPTCGGNRVSTCQNNQCTDSCGNSYPGQIPPTQGSCGTVSTSNIAWSSAPPGSSGLTLCSQGSASALKISGGFWTWTCSGACGGTAASCSAVRDMNMKEVAP